MKRRKRKRSETQPVQGRGRREEGLREGGPGRGQEGGKEGGRKKTGRVRGRLNWAKFVA